MVQRDRNVLCKLKKKHSDCLVTIELRLSKAVYLNDINPEPLLCNQVLDYEMY